VGNGERARPTEETATARLVEEATGGIPSSPSTGPKPIGEEIADLFADVPEEEKARLPTDLSENLDHYLYGARKKAE
jgi:hypothetical protein